MVSEVDRQNARERNMKLKVEGTTAIERLQMIQKKITSGKLHLDVRQSILDVNLMNEMKRKHNASQQMDLEKIRRTNLQYMKLCYKADLVAKKHANKDISDWSSKADIKTYLKPL